MQPDDGRHCTGDGCAIGHKSPVNMQPGNGCHQSRLSRSPVDGSHAARLIWCDGSHPAHTQPVDGSRGTRLGSRAAKSVARGARRRFDVQLGDGCHGARLTALMQPDGGLTRTGAGSAPAQPDRRHAEPIPTTVDTFLAGSPDDGGEAGVGSHKLEDENQPIGDLFPSNCSRYTPRGWVVCQPCR